MMESPHLEASEPDALQNQKISQRMDWWQLGKKPPASVVLPFLSCTPTFQRKIRDQQLKQPSSEGAAGTIYK